MLEINGEHVEIFWPLAQYTVFAVQARYEEGVTDMDAPLERAMVIKEVESLICQVGEILTE